MLGKVMEALHAVPHFPGATVSDCQGQGRGRGSGGRFEPTQETIFFAKKVKRELFCPDAVCDEMAAVIQRAPDTGKPGDGTIMNADLSRIVRIRRGHERDKAV